MPGTPVQWYRVTAFNVNYDAEKSILAKEKAIQALVLFLGGTKDQVCPPKQPDAPVKAQIDPESRSEDC